MHGALLTPPGTIPSTYCPNAVMFATIFAILILVLAGWAIAKNLSLIHISEPTRP